MSEVPTPEQAEEALHLPPLPAEAPWWAKYLVANRAVIAKEFSTWILALLAAVPFIQEAVPDLHLSMQNEHITMGLLAILGIIAKVVRQPPPKE